MALCWYCHWGWPKKVADIYEAAVKSLRGDDGPLLYGPAHVVWADENFDAAQWCLDHFHEYERDYSRREMNVVRRSLVQLVALAHEYKQPPLAFMADEDHNLPLDFPPPTHWQVRHC
jgi:hypothetical protein